MEEFKIGQTISINGSQDLEVISIDKYHLGVKTIHNLESMRITDYISWIVIRGSEIIFK